MMSAPFGPSLRRCLFQGEASSPEAPHHTKDTTMGKFDRRNSMKMKRRKAQDKKKAREARRRAPEVKKAAGAKKATKKAAAPKA